MVETLLSETPEETLHSARLVDGRDLIALGVKPGPTFEDFLQHIEREQLEGRVTSRAEGLHVLASLACGSVVPSQD
jgi:poly(A) polymerase